MSKKMIILKEKKTKRDPVAKKSKKPLTPYILSTSELLMPWFVCLLFKNSLLLSLFIVGFCYLIFELRGLFREGKI